MRDTKTILGYTFRILIVHCRELSKNFPKLTIFLTESNSLRRIERIEPQG